MDILSWVQVIVLTFTLFFVIVCGVNIMLGTNYLGWFVRMIRLDKLVNWIDDKMENQNKEQQNLLDEAYENYSKEYVKDNSIGMCLLVARMDGKSTYRKPNKEMFIGLCQHDKTFSEKWGLKIEERELFRLERINIAIEKKLTHKTAHLTKDFDYQKWCDEQNIPTKLITITYNDQKIESYE
jgi:hypothetical protein